MGKTTNNLERIIDTYVNRDEGGLNTEVEALKAYHYEIINDLFEDQKHRVFRDIENFLTDLHRILSKEP